MATYTAKNLTNDYNSIYAQKKKAINSAYNKEAAQADYNTKNVEREYDNARADSYVAARLNAKSANEQTTAQGLQRGGGTATSGYSDYQRTAQSNALQSGINSLNIKEQQEKEAIAQELINAGYTRDSDTANALAEIKLQQISAQQSENQYAASAKTQAEATQYEQALNRAKILGYVKSSADAKILGVKQGTKIK